MRQNTPVCGYELTCICLSAGRLHDLVSVCARPAFCGQSREATSFSEAVTARRKAECCAACWVYGHRSLKSYWDVTVAGRAALQVQNVRTHMLMLMNTLLRARILLTISLWQK